MKHILKPIILAVLVLCMAMPAQAKKDGYRITLKINHGVDSMMMMGYYYGKGNHVVDTARIDKKGTFVFSDKNTKLPDGLYFFANKHGKYVEFVVYKEEPFFTFETEQKDWTMNMKVKGSKQNETFFKFHHEEGSISSEIDRQKLLMDSATFAPYCREQLMRLDSLKLHFVKSEPNSLLAKMMIATKENYPPLVNEQGDTLSERQRRDYYFAHYFDNLALDDNAMVHAPKAVFYDRVMNFYDNVMKYASPEVIISYMDPMLERSKAAPDVFQFLVVTLTQKYLQSKVMVYDQVYVHLVQKYYASDDNFWSSPSSIESESIRAAKWERLLIGHECPELILYDTLHVPHSLHALPSKWKLLVFWSPNCGHCKHVIPAVYKVFEKYHEMYDIEAFTILSDPDDKTRKEWHTFLAANGMNSPAWLSLDGGEANCDWHEVYDITTTPQIYLIDQNNIIQAKKLGEGNFEQIITAICGEQ